MAYRVSKSEFERLAKAALEELPPELAGRLKDITVEIRQRPSPRERREMNIGPGTNLLGLFRGPSLMERRVESDLLFSPVVFIFQREIEDVCDNVEELSQQVRTTVLHEVGHHFGLSEQDLDALGYG